MVEVVSAVHAGIYILTPQFDLLGMTRVDGGNPCLELLDHQRDLAFRIPLVDVLLTVHVPMIPEDAVADLEL